ncbi:hypothetical protein [Galbibacter pacificus]|uniref:Uncharacterized protein n=1 Tax=Galbibacter pacificus TaxID=2996052 RepID=A0ABT6FRM7_9FLAO|nr:hypothetical protein [Galbibacter pacificus]MDG3582951.1 hypothetical protein [Galbibacter pacificus]MDG3585930.1 hypothetical protein [Galbibacter pacificus]
MKMMILSKTSHLPLFALFTLMMISAKCAAQNRYTGYEYDLNYDDYYEFKYTREYKEEGNIYTTIYKIFHPTKKQHIYTITAVHYKSEKRIKVNVDKAGGGIFAHINDEEITYDNPSLKPFGFRGSVGVLGGSRVPNQLKVKFISGKYENINVANVNSTSSGSNNFYFFVLDDVK